MALFERDYDRDYDRYRWDRPEGRSRWATSGQSLRARYADEFAADRWGYRHGRDFEPYDYAYKSRWETDYGDPYGDRAQRTPIRVIREARHRGYDRGWSTAEPYGGHPMGYRPYREREAEMPGRTYRTYGRRYDGDWL